MRELRYATSVDLPIGPCLSSTDGVTPLDALSITQPDIRLKKTSGAWAQKNAAQTLSHEESGYYEVTLDTTDTGTHGMMRLGLNKPGMVPIFEDFMIIAQAAWDAKYGAGTIDVNVTAMAANVITAAATAADFGTEIGTAVWATAARTLTALDEDNTTLDLDATIRGAVGMAAADLDSQLGAIDDKTTNLPSDPADASVVDLATGAILTAIGGLNDISVTDIFTTKMTEAYSTKGEELTLANFAYEQTQRQQATSIDGTTVTIHERDGTTEALTLTMDDATSPTSVERAT